jgi:hypothetical protein
MLFRHERGETNDGMKMMAQIGTLQINQPLRAGKPSRNAGVYVVRGEWI